MLTHQQKLYAQGRAEGMTRKAAAIAAGCPQGTASQQASRYEKNPEVVDHMIRLGMDIEPLTRRPVRETVIPKSITDAAEKIAERSAQKSDQVFSCPLKYMEHVMNEVAEDPKLRLDAAKALASYIVAKAADKGKKEERQEAAEKVAGTGRFGVAKAPLKVVK